MKRSLRAYVWALVSVGAAGAGTALIYPWIAPSMTSRHPPTELAPVLADGPKAVTAIYADSSEVRLSADAALRRVALTCVLPAVRCADDWRFRKSNLEAWILRRKGAES
jgi:hypothetical protein